MCMFCRSLFVLLAIVLSVHLRFTDSDYHFGIFKLFLSYFDLLQIFHMTILFRNISESSKLYNLRHSLIFPNTSISAITKIILSLQLICLCPRDKESGGILIYPCPSVRQSGYRYMVCPAISSYSFGATALIFCWMFIHIISVFI